MDISITPMSGLLHCRQPTQMYAYNLRDTSEKRKLPPNKFQDERASLQCDKMSTCFEVGMTPEEFCDGYKVPLAEIKVVEGLLQEQVEQSRAALLLTELDWLRSGWVRVCALFS